MSDSPVSNPRISGQLLEPGGPFPNFQLPRVAAQVDAPARPGSSFEFYRDMIAAPSAILIGPVDATAWRMHEAAINRLRANLIVIATDPAPSSLQSSSLPAGVMVLTDRAGRLRQSLRDGSAPPAEPTAVVLDANQRILGHRHDGDQSALIAWALEQLAGLGVERASVVRAQAPVLLLERVMTPAFCRRLIDVWAADHGEGKISAVVDGKPASLVYDAMKRRLDHTVSRPSQLYDDITDEIARKVAPEVFKSFQFEKFRAGEYYIACYDAARADFFAAHRDNTTPQTVKRRFALTVNLNDDYEGGELAFPEFGAHGYRTGTGGGIVFSCSLLHEARPVTRGRRFALLAFLIDPS